MKFHQTKFVPIAAVTWDQAPTSETPAFSSLVLGPYEEVPQAISTGAVPHVVLVTAGEVTLRFPEYDRHLDSENAMHIAGDVSYSIWNHTPWYSKVLRVELIPRSFASPTKSKGSLSLKPPASK